jgi:hypothetical protein
VLFKGSFNSTNNPYAYRGPIKVHEDGLKEQTFVSSPLNLKPGEVVNNYVPVNWPEGKIHIKSYSGDIVKLAPNQSLEVGANGLPNVVPASREEVYLHHWTLNKWQMGKEQYDEFVQKGRDFKQPGPDAGQTHGGNGPCGMILLHFLFGAGNEVRGPPPSGANATYSFPDPYGLETDSEEMHDNGILMLFNAHLIDIRGVADRRGCCECNCEVTGVTWKENYTGGLECCHSTLLDGGHCPTEAAEEAQSYFVQYTITWRDADDEVYRNAPFKPLNAMILDQSDDGEQWYDPVPFPGTAKQSHDLLHNDPTSMASLTGLHSGMRNEDGHVKIHIDAGLFPKPHIKPELTFDTHGCHVEYYVPECKKGDACVHRFRNDWKIPYDMEIVSVHSHVHNAAINMTTSILGGEDICTGLPTYEGDFLVETSKCSLGHGFSEPVLVKKDQHLKVETFYQQDQQPHYGVMGYSMIYSHRLDIKDPVETVMV